MRYALVIIDLQKAYYRGFAEGSMDRACETINWMIPHFREKDLPLIWVQDVDDESGVVPGTEGFEFVDQLTPTQEDYSVYKYYPNSFNKTDLQEILIKEKIDIPVLCGYAAENCVISTYAGAKDLDLTPVLLQGGISSSREEAVPFVSSIRDIISPGLLARLIREE
ncbi:MAG: isochorismatase family protein [Spirochaetales bacterium]|nr:isochorismatase family protein [Spirochaetales bacterium]